MPAHRLDHRSAVKEGESLDALLSCDIAFVAFREPGCPARVFVQHEAALQAPKPGERAFIIAPFESGEELIGCIRPDAEFELGKPTDTLARGPGRASGDSNPGLDRPGYEAAVAEAVGGIRQGALQKVVLARTMRVDLDGLSIGDLFLQACEAHPNAMVTLASTQAHGTWLGASPERLLVLDGERIEVDALAGSMPADSAPADPARWGEKERTEQELVTQEVLESLRRAGGQSVRAHGLAVKHAGSIAHLHTRITGSMHAPDALALARSLHPTPAVGGRPKRAAMELIAALEPRPRSLYAGYWGLIEPGSARLFVNIRCMEIVGSAGLLHVGAGITADSDPERECDEVELKARTWLDLIDAQRADG